METTKKLIALPVRLAAAVERLAAVKGTNFTEEVREALCQYIEEHNALYTGDIWGQSKPAPTTTYPVYTDPEWEELLRLEAEEGFILDI